MPRHRRFVIAAITVGLGFAAGGQDFEEEEPRPLRVGMVAGDLRATDLIGSAIFARDGDRLGQVDDLVLSAEESGIYAVLAVGGLLGIGQRLICVPLDVLEIRHRSAEDGETRVLVLPVASEELQEWPVFRYEVARNAAPAGGGDVTAESGGARVGNRIS